MTDDICQEPGPYPTVPAYEEERMPFCIPEDYDSTEDYIHDPTRADTQRFIDWLTRELRLAKEYLDTLPAPVPAEPKE